MANNQIVKNERLAKRIYKFLDKFAGIKPNWNPEADEDDSKYTSPDASHMRYCADMISAGMKPSHCWSEWGSGGYTPYSSKAGRTENDFLLSAIYKIINS